LEWTENGNRIRNGNRNGNGNENETENEIVTHSIQSFCFRKCHAIMHSRELRFTSLPIEDNHNLKRFRLRRISSLFSAERLVRMDHILEEVFSHWNAWNSPYEPEYRPIELVWPTALCSSSQTSTAGWTKRRTKCCAVNVIPFRN
jgi:hypothetical protein